MTEPILLPNGVKNRIDEEHGFWTVVAYGGQDDKNNALWLCRCKCGTEKVLRSCYLASTKGASCGCRTRLATIARNTKHGKTNSPEHIVWGGMKERCTNPSCAAYKNYGGRGITVCERWLHSFEAFLEDMGPRPSRKHCLERIDNDKGYEPGNVRWATRAEQARNRRGLHRIEYQGRTMILRDWATTLGIPYRTLVQRLWRKWTVEEAFSTPGNSDKPEPERRPAKKTTGRRAERIKDRVGLEYGRYVVVAYVGRNNRGGTRWLCVCECGTERVLLGSYLEEMKSAGKDLSCGCRIRETNLARLTTHGGSSSTEYRIWSQARSRCTRPSNKAYRHYGGRGIAVCERWLGANGFANFLADMGPRPGPKYTLDRIDNDGPYSPENCRWATPTEQARNTRRNRNIEYQGETKTLVEWASILGIPPRLLWRRVRDWGVKKAFATPQRDPEQTKAAKARRAGISPSCLEQRLAMGWTMEEALSRPLRKIRRRVTRGTPS